MFLLHKSRILRILEENVCTFCMGFERWFRLNPGGVITVSVSLLNSGWYQCNQLFHHEKPNFCAEN